MKNIPYGRQSIDAGDIRAVANVLRTDWITQGPKIAEFEEALCRHTGAKFAVAVANGTAALHVACLAAGIGKGDHVMTTPITFVASANCVLYAGGMPVFIDVDKDTVNISSEKILEYLQRETKPKAIIPVHFAGQSCDMKAIHAIAKKNKLLVIEDAAHALGAQYQGANIGSCKFSDMTIFSFHPVKSITTGEGGAIVTNDRAFYKKLLILRNHGITKDKDELFDHEGPWYYEMQYLGFNYRITDFQAALGISQLKKLNSFIAQRRHIAALYDKAFKDNGYFDAPQEKTGLSAYHIYSLRLKDGLRSKRKEIFETLKSNGIGVQVHYMPVYLQPYYRTFGFKKGTCPVAEDYYSRAISIPIYPGLSDSLVRKVISTILKVMEKFNRA